MRSLCAAGLLIGVASIQATASAQTAQQIPGNSPAAGVVQAADGSIYGTTSDGGGSASCPALNGCGTVFKIDSNGVASSIYSFPGNAGSAPGPLGVGSDGNLYGVAGNVVYRLTTAGQFTELGVLNGIASTGSSLLSAYGKFFGVELGGGSSFSFGPNSPISYNAALGNLGLNIIESGLTLGSDGALYGGSYAGGPSNNGCIFRLASMKAKTIHCALGPDFAGGYQFAAGVTSGPKGLLYGVTQGSVGGVGNFYSVSTSGTYTVLGALPFPAANIAANKMALGNDHKFYFTSVDGNSLLSATTSGVIKDLFDFPNENGDGGLTGALLKAKDGTFWGTTTNSPVKAPPGSNTASAGAVFHYDPVKRKMTFVVVFNGQ